MRSKMFFMSLAGIALSLFSFSAHAELQTVPYVDVAKYLGRWYQIARNPLQFEPVVCACSQQTLSLLPSGKVSVFNSCNEENAQGRLREIRGTATNEDPTTNAKFTVDFGLPHTGQYWIIALATDYSWAVVSDPSLLSLYILSKTPELSAQAYDQAVGEAAKQLDVSKLVITPHANCNYPQ